MRLVKWTIAGLVLLVAGGATIYLLRAIGKEPASAAAPTTAVGCLGRIEPGEGVVRLAARSLSGQPSIVGKLLVAEREQVGAGQVLGELDSAEQLLATALLFEARVEVARKRLAQVQTGAKPSDIAAQRAEIERLDVEIDNAQKELRRYQVLRESNSVADSVFDSVRLRADTLAKSRRQATEYLASLSQVRPVDVDLAKAELDAGLREMERARAEHAASLIRAPVAGRVVKIHAWPGEEVGPQGVLELAPTEQMNVRAEIAESDIGRVRVGQRATISGAGLPQAMSGTVERVGVQVKQNSILDLEPSEFSDARVVEARIRLDEGERVAELIHLRVNVLIDVSPRSEAPRSGQ
jgi:HlyD family secretion protein